MPPAAAAGPRPRAGPLGTPGGGRSGGDRRRGGGVGPLRATTRTPTRDPRPCRTRRRQRTADQRGTLGRGDRSHLRTRRVHPHALRDARRALGVEHRDERFTHRELLDRRLDVETGIRAHRLRGRPHRLLVARREGAQGMLHAVPELAEHLVGDVDRILRHEVDAHALRPDEPHHLLDLLQQRGRGVGEEEVRLVEEEDELRLLRVADLGKVLVEFREQPEQAGRRRARGCCSSLSAVQDVHHAASVDGLDQVVDVEHRLAEEPRRPLVLQLQEPALDRPDARRRDVAVLGLHLTRVVADEAEHRAQVGEVEQEEAVVVGGAEGDGEHALLRVVQVEQPREHQRAPCRRSSPGSDAPVRRRRPRR